MTGAGVKREQEDDDAMMRQIEDIHQGSKKRYGNPRVHETLVGR